MINKNYIGKFITIGFTDREETISGYLIDCTDDWTLLKYNPVDYVIDGYVVIRHKNIKGFARDIDEKFKEKVINLKGLKPTDKERIPIHDLATILNYLSDNFGVFQFFTKSEKACYLGKIKSLDSKHLIINYLNPKGKWDGVMTFRPGDIRVIEFDTDYINSLKLLLPNRKNTSLKSINSTN